MNKDEIRNGAFSLIADYEGDISTLFNESVPPTLPILPLRNMMLFPGVMAQVNVARESSLYLINDATEHNKVIGVFCQLDASVDVPRIEDFYRTGVAARIIRSFTLPDGTTAIILQSLSRIHLDEILRINPYRRGRVTRLDDELPAPDDKEFQVLVGACQEATTELLRLAEPPREDAVFAMRNIHNPVFLANFICTNMPLPLADKDKLIQEDSLYQRTYRLMKVLGREVQFARLKRDIQNQTHEELDQQQKEYFLQQQIKNIQNELGGGENEDVIELRKRIAEIQLPEKIEALVSREIRKLEHIPVQAPDYNVQLNYLQTLLSLPWGKETKDNLSIKNAQKQLDHDHYGLEKVKERILEHLAMLQVRKNNKAPILCLYGPPGVGKTSLGKSIATALGRQYVRVSLGGVHDEAEIRGHRRTYIGAMPGRIIKSLVKAGTNNPVFVLDEIDKVSDSNHQGDPQSALLEVLDPEQNNAFHDNYLDIDYDLSKVMFIATANSLNTIPRPLLDRMEIIEVEGYLTEEKKEIARRHLIPRIGKGVDFGDGSNLRISAAAIQRIIESYTRESGVRQLEKQLEKVFRKVALRISMDAEEEHQKWLQPLQPAAIGELLGKPIYNRDIYQGNDYAGVVTGLAWTAVGGEILFIETSVSRSRTPRLTLTGNLGDVMKESAILALEYIKSHCTNLGLDHRIFDHWSIHVHVPEGATPKDGPSAGITIATSLASALTQRKVRKGVAMTGEITLRGKVLPVGGIKEKILAAKRAGLTDIVISKDNRPDIDEIEERYLKGLTFHFVENVNEVLAYALLDEQVNNPIAITVPDESKDDKAQE